MTGSTNNYHVNALQRPGGGVLVQRTCSLYQK